LKPKVVTIPTKVAISAFTRRQNKHIRYAEQKVTMDVPKSHIKWHACFETIHVNRMAIAMPPMPKNGNFN
jgi:hypothetical protein